MLQRGCMFRCAMLCLLTGCLLSVCLQCKNFHRGFPKMSQHAQVGYVPQPGEVSVGSMWGWVGSGGAGCGHVVGRLATLSLAPACTPSAAGCCLPVHLLFTCRRGGCSGCICHSSDCLFHFQQHFQSLYIGAVTVYLLPLASTSVGYPPPPPLPADPEAG